MGDHGLTIMAARSELDFEITTASDSASLNHMIAEVLAAAGDAHVLRDPTRGGLATTLNEIAAASGVSIEIEEAAVPVAEGVMAGCSFLGLDPLYLANEGKLICIVPEEKADTTLEAMRKHPVGANAVRIGTVQAADPGKVILVTTLGGRRLLSMLEGEQLPRIC
jgi:hydrogenase expression/formation protein HypE